MPEETGTTETTTETGTTGTTTETTETDWKAEAEKAKAESSKWEARAKGNRDAVKELERIQREGMTDLEKAVDEARKAGRAEAASEASAALVDARFEAVAAGKLPEDRLPKLLEGIDRSKFLTDDGSVDVKKITDFVESVAPVKGAPDLGQGNRGTGAKADMNSAIRRQMGR